MAPLRWLLCLLILIGLYFAATAVAQAPVEWYSGGGGVAAGPAPDYHGGGALAPSLGTETTPVPATPNLPPPAVPPKADDSPPAVAASAPRPAARARATRALAAPAASTLPSDGSLPFTGFQLGAVLIAGLCLLAGGFALRPTRG
jgi:hypothetical protein